MVQITTLEEGTKINQPVVINVHEILQNAMQSFEFNLNEKGGSVSANFAAKKSTISGIRIHFQQVFQNKHR